MKPFTSIPNFVRFRPGKEIAKDQVEAWLANYYKQPGDFGLVLKNTYADQVGMVHYRYQQTYKGLPLYPGVYNVHTRNGQVVSMNGELFDRVSASATATMSESIALTKALQHMGATTYKWQVPAEEAHLRLESGDANATYYPTGELMVINRDMSMQKADLVTAYKFSVYAHQPLAKADVYVDAANGDIVFTNDRIHTSDSTGTAITGYSGTQTIVADLNNGSFRLRESGRGNGVRTWNMQQGTTFGNAVDFTDTDNFWNNVNAQVDQFGPDAHWGAEMTYDYYAQEHNYNSIDNNGFQLNSYVHYGVNFGNAFWDGLRMTYGDGGNGNNPFCALDVAGHEVTHGLTTFTADLIYQNESGALNESFSDIFGTSIEFFGKPAVANWDVGEDLGFTLRRMDVPNAAGDPDTYLGNFWFSGAGDN
ncbi:MAG: M4 family metallopeptidase, partial [Bacteroidota bacterium]